MRHDLEKQHWFWAAGSLVVFALLVLSQILFGTFTWVEECAEDLSECVGQDSSATGNGVACADLFLLVLCVDAS